MHSSPLISTADLAVLLRHPRTAVLDTSWYLPQAGRDARAEYLAAHIPGAVFFDLDALSDATSSLPHMLLPPDRFALTIGKLGIGDDDLVVVYDGSGTNFSAARAWWMFRIYGHDRVAVLDGGLGAWRGAGLPIESGEGHRAPAQFTPRFNAKLVRSLGEIRKAVETGKRKQETGNRKEEGAQIVDARSPGRFAGTEPEPRPGIRGGHIPGSVNVPYASFTDANGLMLDPRALAERFRAAGVDLDRPVIATCGSGVTACTVLLALDLLGHEDHAVYDGAWTEWGGRDDTAVEGGGKGG